MRKGERMAIAIAIICSIIATTAVVGSTSSSSVNADNLIRNNIEKTVPVEIDGLKEYTWFNGDRKEQVFAALDEVAIFPMNVSETTNVKEKLVRSLDPHATLIKDYEFVTLVRLANRSDIGAIEDKISELQAIEVREKIRLPLH
jgi:hypothetical protein